jgi:hypothetical protein
MKNKLVHRSIIATFVSLYLLVSIISTIHVIEFFKLSNPQWLAISLAIAFELGAAASLDAGQHVLCIRSYGGFPGVV